MFTNFEKNQGGTPSKKFFKKGGVNKFQGYFFGFYTLKMVEGDRPPRPRYATADKNEIYVISHFNFIQLLADFRQIGRKNRQ